MGEEELSEFELQVLAALLKGEQTLDELAAALEPRDGRTALRQQARGRGH